MLLGLGEDAHIASIFPGSEVLERRPHYEGRAAAVWAPHLNVWRITLTPEAILDSQAIVVLVAGTNKADAVHAALRGTARCDDVSGAVAPHRRRSRRVVHRPGRFVACVNVSDFKNDSNGSNGYCSIAVAFRFGT